MDKKTKSPQYFAIKRTKGGIGGQLRQLDALYKIGKSLGYEYVYTPFEHLGRHRFKEEDIDNFFNLGDDESNIKDSMFKNYKIIKIDLNELIDQYYISNIPSLKTYLESFYPKGGVIYLFLWDMKLREKAGLLKKMIGKYCSDNKCLEEKITFPFAEKYWKKRKEWPVNLPFDKNKIKVVMHIRGGIAHV